MRDSLLKLRWNSQLYERLRAEWGDPRPAFMARGPVTWEIANCLSLCGGGPNLVIYPDEEWHHQLDADTLERVIAALRSPDERDPQSGKASA